MKKKCRYCDCEITMKEMIEGLEFDLKIYEKLLRDSKKKNSTIPYPAVIEAHYQADYIRFLLNEVVTGNVNRIPR